MAQDRKRYLKLIAHLAWPTILEQTLSTLVSYVDTAMVGSLGKEATAAVGSTMTVNWMLGSVVMALGVGFLAYIARNMGAGRREQARKASAQAVTVAVSLGLIMTAVVLPLAHRVPAWMRADEAIRDKAGKYLFILYVPMVFRCASIMFGTVLRASGDTRTPMRVNTGVNVINVALNFLLIYKTRELSLLGISFTCPGADMGVTGAAVASAAAFTAGGIWMTVSLYKSPVISPKGCRYRPDKTILGPCFRVALPSCLQRLATSSGYVVFSSMINSIGQVSTAAHTIANTAESAFYIPGWGMQTAASTLIGNAYGEGDREKLKALSRLLLIIEFIVMTVSGAVLLVGAEGLVALFNKDEEVISLGSKVLRMVAVSEPIYGIAIIIEGIFNGIGDTFHSFLFNVAGMWGIRILGTYIFVSQMGGDLTAAWGCMIAHNVCLGIMLSIKYLRGRWRPGTNAEAKTS
ncbi:MAG: MATE family efflux transporter [Clostridiales bacterium]|nr:MATE family efflux transporter [Clostridiales bacterium]